MWDLKDLLLREVSESGRCRGGDERENDGGGEAHGEQLAVAREQRAYSARAQGVMN